VDRDAKRLWDIFDAVFQVMPLAAIIDSKLFCCHGGMYFDISHLFDDLISYRLGIPRIVMERTDVLNSISSLQRPLKCD